MLIKRHLTALMAATFVTISGSAWSQVELPVVPVQVVSNNQKAPAPSQSQESRQPAASHGMYNDTSTPVTDMRVKPGVNEIAVVSIGHINRIVTPFETPEVWTASPASITTRDNVLYLMPETETPVTMYITEAGDETVAVSLTLAPRRVPPRELRVTLDTGAMQGVPMRSARARNWERSQPYIDTIRMLFRELAVGDLPPGFTVREVRDGDYVPRCYRPTEGIDYHFAPGQVVIGSEIEVLVGTAVNRGQGAVELQELWCADHAVAAVAYWPHVVLSPNEVTEVFVAIRKETEQARPTRTNRPSLLRGDMR